VWAEQNVGRGKGEKIKTPTVRRGEKIGKYDVKEGFGNYMCTKNIKTSSQERNKREQNHTRTTL
jgi:hypothetical protein